MRPPWSLPEMEFTEACTRCGACVNACPTGLVTTGHAGYPIVAFGKAECTFCGACADACKEDCFVAERGSPAWALVAGIATTCVEIKGVACRMCEDQCEVSAIRFRPMPGGRARAEVDHDRCTGCGACVSSCPVRAISIQSPSMLEQLT